MTDRILLHGVEVSACHGVLDAEKVRPQTFLADVVLEVDLAAAAESDDLERTISYAEVAADVEAVLAGPTVELIEVLAGRIAEAALQRRAVEAVEVTVRKPQAPAGVVFEAVPGAGPAVQLRRTRDVPVVIAMGANLGRPARVLTDALARLRAVPGLDVVTVSDLVSTAPVGGPEQPDYLNAVVIARTRLAPWTLLRALHTIEAEFGRTREIRWAARTLDLDLIQVGTPGSDDEVRSERADLALPHPRAHERSFVLTPWLDADPGATVRVGDHVRPVAEAIQAVADQQVAAGPQWERR
ncbi:2-amino-4-hydroxy-6-hydroxymethyldihydropteridine diphosphokinase [Dermacoccaceae bacterium W4C1]